MTENIKSSRSGYHHGNLNEVLVEVAIALIEERGVDKLSVREVAKAAGVSPGAPFRHFSSKKALLTAVAEQSADRFIAAMQDELARADLTDPVAGMRAIGRGYMNWVFHNPTHFQIVSSRSSIDFKASPKLTKGNETIRLMMASFISKAQAEGRADPNIAVDDLIFSSRAFVYGVARMWVDGHFEEWGVSQPPLQAMYNALDMFIMSLEIKG